MKLIKTLLKIALLLTGFGLLMAGGICTVVIVPASFTEREVWMLTIPSVLSLVAGFFLTRAVLRSFRRAAADKDASSSLNRFRQRWGAGDKETADQSAASAPPPQDRSE